MLRLHTIIYLEAPLWAELSENGNDAKCGKHGICSIKPIIKLIAYDDHKRYDIF